MMIGVQWSYIKHIFSISSLLTKGCIVQHANKSHTCALRMDVKERFVNGQVGQSEMFMHAYPSLSPAKFNQSSIASWLWTIKMNDTMITKAPSITRKALVISHFARTRFRTRRSSFSVTGEKLLFWTICLPIWSIPETKSSAVKTDTKHAMYWDILTDMSTFTGILRGVTIAPVLVRGAMYT